MLFLSRFANYSSWLERVQAKFGFEEQYIIFRLQLEEDFFAAQLTNSTLLNNAINDFQFEIWEWDYENNNFEKITVAYNFKSSTKELRKKRGAANFTSIVQAVESFNYQITTSAEIICLKIEIKNLFEKQIREDSICRNQL